MAASLVALKNVEKYVISRTCFIKQSSVRLRAASSVYFLLTKNLHHAVPVHHRSRCLNHLSGCHMPIDALNASALPSSAVRVSRRCASSAVPVDSAAVSSAAITDLTLPESLVDVASSAVDLATNISGVAEPTLRSLGLGLANWWPSSFVQAGLENIHVGLGLPWWASIVVGTICLRLMVFPLVIMAQRNAAMLTNHMPTIQRLQQRMIAARANADPQEAIKASNELTNYMRRNNVNPLGNFPPIIAQAVIFSSVFFGIRSMASLPVASMQNGGILWFTDLTVTGPIYGLPLMTAATLLATIEVGVDGIKANQLGSQQMKYVMRAMPFMVFPFIINFPSAMLCYWFTSNSFSLAQVLFLRIPAVRDFFQIPRIIRHEAAAPLKTLDVPKKGFVESFRENYENMKLSAEIQERQRLDALKMKDTSQKSVSVNDDQVGQPNQTDKSRREKQTEQ